MGLSGTFGVLTARGLSGGGERDVVGRSICGSALLIGLLLFVNLFPRVTTSSAQTATPFSFSAPASSSSSFTSVASSSSSSSQFSSSSNSRFDAASTATIQSGIRDPRRPLQAPPAPAAHRGLRPTFPKDTLTSNTIGEKNGIYTDPVFVWPTPTKKEKIASEQDFDAPDFRYTLILLSYDRPQSFKRLLDSVLAADYDGDTIDIEFFVDYPSPTSTLGYTYRTRECRQMAVDFPWPHGRKSLHFRSANAGLVHTWLQSWYPSTDLDIGIYSTF